MFSTFSNSGETSLDLMLKKWGYPAIKKFLATTHDF